MLERGVISVILRPNASTWSEDRRIAQAKEATDFKVQDQNNVDLLFDIRGMYHFEFVPEETTVNQTFYVEMLKTYSCHEA
jgi:hypothetical protein